MSDTVIQPRITGGRLVGDIGGTNARFAWQTAAGAALSHTSTLRCADFGSLVAAIRHYLLQQGLPNPQALGLGIATPVAGDHVQMTNHHWSFSVAALKSELGSDIAVVVNDFVALASAVPGLTDNDVVRLNGAQRKSRAPIVVIGAGTGLGVASLIADAHGEYRAVPGEGGHMTLAATTDLEAEIIRELRKRFGHVSAERALSGPGLIALYEAHCALRGEVPKPFSASDITSNAIGHRDLICSETLSSFVAFFGNVCGNLALTLGSFGGVYIGGGIVPKLGTRFDSARFLEAFTQKGRFTEYLAAVPCFVITCEAPALIGAARVLQEAIGASSTT